MRLVILFDFAEIMAANYKDCLLKKKHAKGLDDWGLVNDIKVSQIDNGEVTSLTSCLYDKSSSSCACK